MGFTIDEWLAIKNYLGTALEDTLDSASRLEKEMEIDPTCFRDYMDLKRQSAQIKNFITRIETATI